PLRERFEAHRTTDSIALGNVAAHVDQEVEDLAMLDTFSDDLAVERVRKTDGRLDHQSIASAVGDTFDEALVDLDLCRRNLLQILKGRQARAVIVDGDPNADVAQPADHVEALARAGKCSRFGQLERQVPGIEAVTGKQRRQAKREALVAQEPSGE